MKALFADVLSDLDIYALMAFLGMGLCMALDKTIFAPNF